MPTFTKSDVPTLGHHWMVMPAVTFLKFPVYNPKSPRGTLNKTLRHLTKHQHIQTRYDNEAVTVTPT